MIYAHPPMVLYNGSSVAVVFEVGDRQVSLALDNSCSGDRSKKLSRADIRLFSGVGEDTAEVFADLAHEDGRAADQFLVHASMENFMRAMTWLQESCNSAEPKV